MLRKKLAVCLAAGLAAIALTGCGGSPEPIDGTSGGSSDISVDDGLIKVGVINLDPDESSFRAANVRDLKEAFTKEKGYNASFAYSNNNEEQIEAARAYIGKGVDYLLLAAADTSGWDSVLQDAKTANTKVILFDRTIDVDEQSSEMYGYPYNLRKNSGVCNNSVRKCTEKSYGIFARDILYLVA